MSEGPEWVRLVVSQLWQVTLLIPVAIVLLRLVCRRRSHLSYALLLVVLIKCITPPVFISAVGAFSWMESAAGQAPVRKTHAERVPHKEVTVTPMGDDEFVASPAVVPVQPDPALNKVKLTSAQRNVNELRTAGVAATASPAVSLIQVVLGVYLLGLAAIAGWLVRSRWRLQRLLAATYAPQSKLLETCSDLSQRLGLRHAPRLRITGDASMPMALGVIRPTIVIPQFVVESADAQEMELILAHELNHFRRRDLILGAIQLGVQVVWWFHPLVWWLNRELRRLREQCCDEEVLARLECRPQSYAHCLLNVLELNERCSPALALAGMSPFEVTSRRLRNIMRPSGAFSQQTPKWCWCAAVAASALILPGASASIDSERRAERTGAAPVRDVVGGAGGAIETAAAEEVGGAPLRYVMAPGGRYVYRVSIEVEHPDYMETHVGSPVLAVGDVSDGMAELMLNASQLHVTQRPKANQWPPVFPMTPPPSIDGFPAQRVVRIDDRGRIAAEQGDAEELPLFLGSLVELLLPSYPDDEPASWSTASSRQLQIVTTPESEAVRVLSMLTAAAPELVAADEAVRFEIQSIDGEHATLDKRWNLASLQTVRGEPRVESTGAGTIVVNRAGGHVESIDAKATVTVRDGNVSRKYPVTINVELTNYQPGDGTLQRVGGTRMTDGLGRIRTGSPFERFGGRSRVDELIPVRGRFERPDTVSGRIP